MVSRGTYDIAVLVCVRVMGAVEERELHEDLLWTMLIAFDANVIMS